MTDVRPLRRGLLALAAMLAFMALEPVVAAATHVFPNSVAACERQDATTGTFDCTLTIVIGLGQFPGPPVVRVDDDPSIGVNPIGATFNTVPVRIGGTCAPTTVVPFGALVSLVLGGDLLDGCTIILHETLTAQPPGEVCHSLTAIATNSVAQVVACATLLPALTEPTSRKQCKKDGWRNFPHLGFKNKRDCVKFVKHKGGKTPPD